MGRVFKVSCTALFAAIAALGMMSVAQAQTAYYGGYNGNPDHLTLSVPVTASVGGVCGFASGEAPSGSYDAGDIRGAFSHNFPFVLECSVPLRMLRPGEGIPYGVAIAIGSLAATPWYENLRW